MRGFFREAETRPAANHLTLIASGEKRKAFVVRGTFESKETIAIDSRVTGEDFVSLFTAHAFNRIPPNAFDSSDYGHNRNLGDKYSLTSNKV